MNGNLVTSILREGEFIKIEDDLFFQLRERRPDGTLRGIFLSDSREDEETVDYIAERGAVLDSPLGIFLVLSDGTIQTRKEEDSSLSIIQFTSYAFDLSTFSSPSKAPAFMPNERPTGYLLSPDPDDRYYQRHSGKFTSELHTRFTTPINAFLFAVIPLLFLSQAETVRQKRSATIAIAATSAVALAGLEFVLEHRRAGPGPDSARDVCRADCCCRRSARCSSSSASSPGRRTALSPTAEKLADGFRGIFRRKAAPAASGSG